jgi:hypothetical protein
MPGGVLQGGVEPNATLMELNPAAQILFQRFAEPASRRTRQRSSAWPVSPSQPYVVGLVP